MTRAAHHVRIERAIYFKYMCSYGICEQAPQQRRDTTDYFE